MSRYNSTVVPKPWAGRPGGGGHPLAGGNAVLPFSQPENSSRPALSGRPGAALVLPCFSQRPQQSVQQTTQPPLQQQAHFQAMQMSQPRPAPGHMPPPARPQRPSQPAAAASHMPASYPPWSQRSQMDNVMLGYEGFEEEQTVGETMQMSQEVAGPLAVVVGSAPPLQQQQQCHMSGPTAGATAAEIAGDGLLCSQEINLQSKPANAAAKVLQNIAKQQGGFGLEDPALLGELRSKLDAVEGRQGTLAAALGALQTDVAAQGVALQGVGQVCTELLQAVQCLKGASTGIEERLQALLAKQQLPPPRVTGDMATQTSPAAAEPATGLLLGLPPAAVAAVPAVAQVPPSILRAFNQRRPSSADMAQPAPHDKPTALLPAPAPARRRGLASTAPGPPAAAIAAPSLAGCFAAVPAKPTKPTTSSRAAQAVAAPPPTRRSTPRSTRLAESQQQDEQPTTAGAAAGAPPPVPTGPSSGQANGSSRSKRSSTAKTAVPPVTAPAPSPLAAPAPSSVSQPSPLVQSAAARTGAFHKTAPPAAAHRQAARPLTSFTRKRALSAGPESAGKPPSTQEQQQPTSKRQRTQAADKHQQEQQEPASKVPINRQASQKPVRKLAVGKQLSQQLASKPPANKRQPPTQQPSMQPASKPPSRLPPSQQNYRPPLRTPPASQAEALFDSLFGDDNEAEPVCALACAPSSGTDSDLAAAVQRQLARHQQRVAQTRQQHLTQLSDGH